MVDRNGQAKQHSSSRTIVVAQLLFDLLIALTPKARFTVLTAKEKV